MVQKCDQDHDRCDGGWMDIPVPVPGSDVAAYSNLLASVFTLAAPRLHPLMQS